MNHAPLTMAFETACQAAAVPIPTIRPGGAVGRVHATLLRRIDGCAERRTAAALAPGDDSLAVWRRECERGDKLRRALISHLRETGGTEG